MTFLAVLIACQLGLAVLGLVYVLVSTKREYSKDVQTLRWLALAAPAIVAWATLKFHSAWFPLLAGWAALEFALLLFLVRPLNLWAVIQNKGDPGEPPT